MRSFVYGIATAIALLMIGVAVGSVNKAPDKIPPPPAYSTLPEDFGHEGGSSGDDLNNYRKVN